MRRSREPSREASREKSREKDFRKEPREPREPRELREPPTLDKEEEVNEEELFEAITPDRSSSEQQYSDMEGNEGMLGKTIWSRVSIVGQNLRVQGRVVTC